MVHAFVTVRIDAGVDVETVLSAITAVDAVETTHTVAGDVDVIAELNVAETYDVMGIVTDQIRSVDGVEDTTTYISIG